jgi:hypothetical protein
VASRPDGRAHRSRGRRAPGSAATRSGLRPPTRRLEFSGLPSHLYKPLAFTVHAPEMRSGCLQTDRTRTRAPHCKRIIQGCELPSLVYGRARKLGWKTPLFPGSMRQKAPNAPQSSEEAGCVARTQGLHVSRQLSRALATAQPGSTLACTPPPPPHPNPPAAAKLFMHRPVYFRSNSL